MQHTCPTASGAPLPSPLRKPADRRRSQRRRAPLLAWACGLLGLLGTASAAQLQSIAPQGQVSSATQVVVTLQQAAVPLGQPDAAAPVQLQCDGAPTTGQGRWISERRWVFDFEQPLPGGVRCTVMPSQGFRDLDDQPLAGFAPHRFDTGGPAVQTIYPSTWEGGIDEQQYFLLALNSPVRPESVAAHAWCQAEDIGERIPVRVLPPDEQAKLLDYQQIDQAAPANGDPSGRTHYLALGCQRRLTPGTTLQLHWGAGIEAPNGLATTAPQQFEYEVRQPFEASFSCQRENAARQCIPVLPMRLQFSAELPLRWLSQIRLRADHREWPAVAQNTDRWGYAQDDAVTLEQWQADPDAYAGRMFNSVRFEGPFPADTQFELIVPPEIQDESGRALENAVVFPLRVATDRAPALAKFATGDFAVIERFAEGNDAPALLPVTLRAVEAPLPVRMLRLDSDAEIIEWMYRSEQLRPGRQIERRQAQRLDLGPLPSRQSDAADPGTDVPRQRDAEPPVEARTLSLLASQPQAQQKTIPASSGNPDREASEVVGIPLQPGFQIVEIASPTLGEALLDPAYGMPRTLYARTSVLVTNLAVHFKLGAENALAWVTALDSGRPVANARVQVSRCDGEVVAQGTTDAQGIARFDQLGGTPARCEREKDRYWHPNAYLVSARSDDGDLGLVWSDWQRGIEPWRFNVPTSYRLAPQPLAAHTVLDRTLLRAGETVSMKHYLRTRVLDGFGAPAQRTLPDELLVRHAGSGREFIQPLQWQATAGSGASATSELALPRLAPLGTYEVQIRSQGDAYDGTPTGSFRVEEFRLPVFEGRIVPLGAETAAGADALELGLQLDYVSGGPAAHWPVQVSALLEPRALQFSNYEGYTFAPPQPPPPQPPPPQDAHEPDRTLPERRLLLDKQPVALDAQGHGQIRIDGLAAATRSGDGQAWPRNLRIEATFEDPNGEMQTLTRVQPLWPSDVLAGIDTEHWVSVKQTLPVRTIALSPQGQPVAGAAITVRARAHTTLTTRKRMVGGFYKYEHHYESRDLGALCNGRSDASGRFDCQAELSEPGEIELLAEVSDSSGQRFVSATSVWVARGDAMWFGGDASDRMDVLPEKPSYQPGETARFQVRMPYRHAQALIAVEREGILDTQVLTLSGDDPSFSLPIDAAWSPNVYVSVLAVRGRLREVPWYSFFTWGFRSPRIWWQAWRDDTGEAVPPTALVDLSKPSHRFGVASIRVGHEGHRLQVQVTPDKPRYGTREHAELLIQAHLPDGQPAAHAEVALAVVDQALLELGPNPSWQLLDAMMRNRSWAVQTATAQMEVLGRRHYGRKAMPAGGGGGASGEGATRELFDTLLAWQPRIPLDAQGQARVQVPLNDSITTFHAEAIADAGLQYFGSGSASLVVAQDLQIISGLPPVVRAGDRYGARFTVRNATDTPLRADISARHGQTALPPQSLELPAGAAQTVQWRVTAPALPDDAPQTDSQWTVQAEAQALTPPPVQAGPASGQGQAQWQDRVQLRQTVLPAVPVTVRQASLRQLSEALELPVALPQGAEEGRGGLRIDAQASLAGDVLPGLQRWWQWYPYTCIEQRYSKAIGLLDPALLRSVQADLPSHLDKDGLAAYFPPSRADAGSVYLTAHLLAADAAVAALATPDAPDAARMAALRLDATTRQTMQQALAAFVEGRLERPSQGLRNDRTVERLMAIAALASHGAAHPSMLESLQIVPQRLPTHAVLDWLHILKILPGVPQQPQRLAEAEQELRSRIVHTGAQLLFTTERSDNWWWMMQNADTNAARLVLLTADLPGWQDDAGPLASGLLARQRDGHWGTTTANLWGQLAVRQFARLHESVAVTGALRATLGGEQQQQDWLPIPATANHGAGAGTQPDSNADAGADAAPPPANPDAAPLRLQLPWPDAIARLAAPEQASRLRIEQLGSGHPWVSIAALAAVPLTEPVSSGLRIEKTITPVAQAREGQWSQGDVYRVQLTLHSQAPTGMAALTDPIPSGSTILGGGLGRDSAIAATQGDDADEATRGPGWYIAWEERKQDAMRVYFHGLPTGATRYSYTVRLNQPGEFRLPPTRAEALYMPQVFGEAPNAAVSVADLPR